jgi:hypothetical protein
MKCSSRRPLPRAAVVFILALGSAATALAQKAALVQGEGGRAANLVAVTVQANPTGPVLVYTVPSTSVFVLETVSFITYNDSSQEHTLFRTTPGNPTNIQLGFSIPSTRFFSGGGQGSPVGNVLTQQVLVRYPPSSSIQANYWTGRNISGEAVSITLSGHLEPQ